LILAVPDKEIRLFADKQLLLRSRQANAPIIRELRKQISLVNQQMQQLIASDAQLKRAYDLMTSVPGVGPVIAIQMLVITRCFTVFDDPRKFACYCGIAPFEYQSGSSIRGRTRVSHLANKKMKSLMNMGALVAVQHDTETRLHYQRKIKEGKNPMLVLNAIRNKTVHRVFATIKRGTPYVPLARFAA
jgi:transposase